MIISNYRKFLESNRSDMWDIIPDSVKELHGVFSRNGKKLYVVGGSVRDFLMGDEPKDFDLATDANPDEVISIIKSVGLRTNLQGKAFGVVVVYTEDQPLGIEIATFREDFYDSDKLGVTRNPEVSFTTIDNDVKRRDIPFNSLFYDLGTRQVVDLVGGIDDIKNRITRFVGDPDTRIKEDPLRILRVLRFAFRYSFRIDEKTLDSIRKNKSSLSIISKERIWEEIKKAFGYTKKSTIDFNSYLQYFSDLGLWSVVFPGVSVNEHQVDSSNLIVLVANLFVNNDHKTVERKMVNDFKIEGDLSSKVGFLISFLKFTPETVFETYKHKVRCHINDSTVLEWIQVQSLGPIFRKFVEYSPTVSSDELMSLGFSGKSLGDEIRRIEIENFKKMI
jgi:tRNA nucleotidyltransferase/poly(A) polymerase